MPYHTPPKKKKVHRGFLRDSEGTNVIQWPTLDLNSGRKNRWF